MQDVEEDKIQAKASVDIQKAWRGCAGRKGVRWVRMEHEGRRRLARFRMEEQVERRRKDALEREEKALEVRFVALLDSARYAQGQTCGTLIVSKAQLNTFAEKPI